MCVKIKRFSSIIIIAVLVIAMVAACGKKEEAAKTEKTEASTEAEGNQRQADEEDVAESEEITECGVTEEQLQDWYHTIESTMITEYIEPNNIEDFQWPTDEIFWSDCTSLLTSYCIFVDLQSMDLNNLEVDLPYEELAVYKELQKKEPVVDDLYTSEENKAVIQAVYNATRKWAEKNEIDFGRFKIDQFSCQENFSANTFQ